MIVKFARTDGLAMNDSGLEEMEDDFFVPDLGSCFCTETEGLVIVDRTPVDLATRLNVADIIFIIKHVYNSRIYPSSDVDDGSEIKITIFLPKMGISLSDEARFQNMFENVLSETGSVRLVSV